MFECMFVCMCVFVCVGVCVGVCVDDVSFPFHLSFVCIRTNASVWALVLFSVCVRVFGVHSQCIVTGSVRNVLNG